MSIIGVTQDVARRIERCLRELKPAIVEAWADAALDKSARLRFSNPLPSAVYTKVFGEFVDTLCDSLAHDDLAPAEQYWLEQAHTGTLNTHTPDELEHLCVSACRSISQVVKTATESAEDGSRLRCSLERILARVRDGLERERPQTPPTESPTAALSALVTAAEDLRQGLAWSELYDRDIRRSRRLEALRLMLIEIRGVSPAKAAESILRRLYEELPCRICLLARSVGRGHGLRLEAAWPGEQLPREIGEEMPLDPDALARLPHTLHAVTLALEHARGGLDAEVAAFGVRAMLVAPLPRGQDPAGWLVVGLDDANALAPDDIEFAETAAVVLGAALDNALLSLQLGSAVNRLRQLIQAAPEPILLLDPTGLVLDLSDAAAHALGMQRSDLTRTNLSEKNVLGARDELSALLESAAAAAGPVARLLTGQRPDGTTFRAACSVAALEDGSRILAFRNITNVARAAALHREAKARYRALLDSAADVVFLLDTAGRCIDVGRRALAAYGIDPAQVIKRTPVELLDKATATHVLKLIRQVLDQNTPSSSELDLVVRGEELAFDVTFSPVHAAPTLNTQGDVVGVLGVARDVTAARRLEREVHRLGALGGTVFRSAPVGIAVLEETGTIITANNALARLLRPDATADELIGLRLIGDDSPLAAIGRELAQAFEGTPFSTRPFKLVPGEAHDSTWLAARGVQTVEEGTGHRRVVLFVQDVSDHVRLQKELVESEKAAAVSALATDLVHDLNMRLGPIVGHAQMLQHSKIGITEMAHVNAIERCAQSVRRLVESLLAFSSPAAPTPHVCDLNRVIREACAAIERQDDIRDVAIALKLDDRLPATLADERQLVQVFLSLLGSAYQAMHDTGGRVTIATASTGSTITVTGSVARREVAQEHLERMAKPSSPSRRAKLGADLGLTVARAIIRNHGGSISFTSRPERGTMFHIELPVKPPAPAAARPSSEHPLGAARPLHVLLLDHDEEMLAMMKKLLVGAGHHVAACAAARQALEQLHSAPYDVVIADIGMPGLSGTELHARLTADHPELASRMVFTTAGVCDPRTSAFIHNAGSRLVTKPFNVRDLLNAITDAAS